MNQKSRTSDFIFFLVFAAQKQIFLENLWSSSSSFHIEVVPTFSTTPEQPAIHSNRLDYKDGIFWFFVLEKKTLLHPHWVLRYPALTDAHPRWRLLWTGGLGIRGRGGDGTLVCGRTWGCVWGRRRGQGWNLCWCWGHVCQVGSAWGRGSAPLQPPLLQSQFLLDFLHFSSQLPPFSFEALPLSLAYCPVSSPGEPGLKCHQEHLFVDF